MEYKQASKTVPQGNLLTYISKLGKSIIMPVVLTAALYGCGQNKIPIQTSASQGLRPSPTVLRPTQGVSNPCFYENQENPNTVYVASQGEDGKVMLGAALDTITISEAQSQGIERCLE